MNGTRHLTLNLILYMAFFCLEATAPKQPPLTDPILKIIDGKAGVFDKTKVQSTLWLIKEIKNIHEGKIKLNENGDPDPREGKSVDIMFKGEKQTIKSLIAYEAKQSSFTASEKEEFKELFLQVKKYFGHVNNIMLADARGAQQFMIKLLQEYCRKNNRPDCLLLKWDDKGNETETYDHDVTSFSVFYVFTTDLQNFLAALIVSCPKAYAQAKEAYSSQKKGA